MIDLPRASQWEEHQYRWIDALNASFRYQKPFELVTFSNAPFQTEANVNAAFTIFSCIVMKSTDSFEPLLRAKKKKFLFAGIFYQIPEIERTYFILTRSTVVMYDSLIGNVLRRTSIV